jgi:hypothetical protein
MIAICGPMGQALSTGDCGVKNLLGDKFDVRLRLSNHGDAVGIQSKNRRLGMGLIGQVIVSRDLVERLGVKVMRSVAVCTEMDTVMHKMLRQHPRCRAVVYHAAEGRKGKRGRLKGAKVQIGQRPVQK